MDTSWVTPDFLNGIGVVGIVVLVMLMVTFGKGLALMREVKDRDKTIAWQRETIKELTEQNGFMLHEQGRAVTKVFDGIHEVVEGREPA